MAKVISHHGSLSYPFGWPVPPLAGLLLIPLLRTAYLLSMKHWRFLFWLLLLQLLSATSGSQEKAATPPPEQFGLAHLTEYLGLKPDDISFRSDYEDADSFRLQIVADLMQKPLGMIDYAAGLKNAHVVGQPEVIVSNPYCCIYLTKGAISLSNLPSIAAKSDLIDFAIFLFKLGRYQVLSSFSYSAMLYLS
jgi:hypothetical protein